MNSRNNKANELDILFLAWSLWEQWRGIIAAGLIVAVFLSGIYFIKGTTTVPITISTDMYTNANDALSKYTVYVQAKRNYESNFANKYDPSNCTSYTFIYEISTEGDASDLFTLSKLYSYLKNDKEFTENMFLATKEYWNEMESQGSLYYILSTSSSLDIISDSNNRFTMTSFVNPKKELIYVTIVLPTDTDETIWRDTLTENLESYRKKISGNIPENSIKYIYFISTAINPLNENNSRALRKANVDTTKEAYDTFFEALDINTQALISETLKECGDSHLISDYSAILDKKRAEANESAQTSFVTRHFSIKIFILGLLIGIMIYMMAYLAYFILVRLIRNEDELTTAFGIRNFGGIYEYPYTGKLARFIHDKKIYKYRTRRSKSLSRINDDIATKLDFSNQKETSIISLGSLTEKAQLFNKEQTKFLEDRGISVKEFNIEECTDKVEDSVYVNMHNVLIVLLGNRTKWKDLTDLYFKLREYDVTIIGSEYFEV